MTAETSHAIMTVAKEIKRKESMDMFINVLSLSYESYESLYLLSEQSLFSCVKTKIKQGKDP